MKISNSVGEDLSFLWLHVSTSWSVSRYCLFPATLKNNVDTILQFVHQLLHASMIVLWIEKKVWNISNYKGEQMLKSLKI